MKTPGSPTFRKETARRWRSWAADPPASRCAYFLTLKGYAPTIFESSPNLGGMLRYGIPEYRLPKALLDREIKWITDLGVEVKTGDNGG